MILGNIGEWDPWLIVFIMSFHSVFLMLCHLEASLTLERWPLQGLAIPTDRKRLACKCVIKMQTNQSSANAPNHHLHLPLTLCTTVPLPHWLLTRFQTTRHSSVSPNLPKCFKLANPKPYHLALPPLSHKNHNECSCPHFLLTSSASWLTLLFPHVPISPTSMEHHDSVQH